MRRLLAAIAILLVPVQAASADAVRDAPTPGVATCLRATGAPGELTALGPLTRTTSSIDVLGAAGDAITPIANNPFGVLDQCPVTASGGGTTVVAGVVRTGPKTRAMRASVRSGAGALAGPVTLAEFPKVLGEDDFAVGVGPHGDAAVAWVERRNRTAEFVETRVLVARRPAGGSFGPAVVVQDWQKVADTYDTAQIAAGVDAAGTATVAWMRGRDFENIDVLVAAVAPAGPAATPVRLGTSYEGDARVALAVAGNGRALAVWTSPEGPMAAERTESSFGRGAPLVEEEETLAGFYASNPSAAIRDDGAALVAWNSGPGATDVRAIRRPPGGAWTAPAVVGPQRFDPGLGDETAIIITDRSGPPGPPDDDPVVHALLTDSGDIALGWVGMRRYGADLIATAYVARGTLSRGFGAAHRLSGECRPANGAVAVPTTGAPLFAWTDNSTSLTDGFALTDGDGRLHVTDDATTQPEAAPKLTVVESKRAQSLYFDGPVEVTASCDRPCDVRAWLPMGNHATLGALSTTLPANRRTRVRIAAGADRHHVVARGAGTVPVLLRACGLDGTGGVTTEIHVPAKRRTPPPFAVPRHVKARRSGDSVVVTWTTDVPARRVFYSVSTQRSRQATPDDYSSASEGVNGDGQRRFRVRLDAPGARFAGVDAFRRDLPPRLSQDFVRIK